MHLGGHGGVTHTDVGVLSLIKGKYDIKSMLDIGCGPGGMMEIAWSLDIYSEGIDGDYTVDRGDRISPFVTIHDFTKGPSPVDKRFDLIWSVEFLEHVEEKYMDNYMKDFQLGKYVLLTFNRGLHEGGHHHVNCQEEDYWVKAFEERGFMVDWEMTKNIREASTMKKPFIRNTGLFLVNTNL
jgi:SAM-dependent methyltransferase